MEKRGPSSRHRLRATAEEVWIRPSAWLHSGQCPLAVLTVAAATANSWTGDKPRVNGDLEALSPHSESTDTASDCEGHLSEDSSEAEPSAALGLKRTLVAEQGEKLQPEPLCLALQGE